MLPLTDAPTPDKMILGEMEAKTVKSFEYLGLMLSSSLEDVATRVAGASKAFRRVNSIWGDRSVSRA